MYECHNVVVVVVVCALCVYVCICALLLQIGTRVLAKWEETDAHGKATVSWYPATIIYVYTSMDERMYDIVYYDGEVDKKKHHASVHEYDAELDDINTYKNITGKSRRMKLLMLLWLSILYSYSFLKLVAFCFNAMTGEFVDVLPMYEAHIRRFHQAMMCVTIPVMLASIYLWFITVGHFWIMCTKAFDCGSSDAGMQHVEVCCYVLGVFCAHV
jgi:hypothetical protein